MDAPCTVANCVRIKFWPKSLSCCSVNPLPDSPSCSTGTLDALYWITRGGCVPWGYCRSDVCAMAVTWATACEMFTDGRKKILVTETPFNVCDSVCSMSLTVVVRLLSNGRTMRSLNSCGDNPAYCQTTDTTGMSMLGKISTGVRIMATGPMTKSSNDTTTKVQG